MSKLRPKIVQLAKMVGGISGVVNKIDENAPEYYSLADILTDEEAEVALAAGLRKNRTVEYLAKKTGKSIEETKRIADRLAWIGVFRCTYEEEFGQDCYYVQIYAPGILEMLVNNKELLEAHPEVARAFEEYTRTRIAKIAPMLPDGYGLMRVAPVESALEGVEGVTDDERISCYLNRYDRFSVAPCSCRATRRVLDQGCGHLEEDMCIQMGKGAEHFIRTGRAREITREEALEILKRAEDNGLVHNLPNIEEVGDSAAICNCCGCSCFGLRAGLMFGARDAIRSNFEARIDETKCVACGMCVENCQANALKLGQKLCTKEPLAQPEQYKKMSNSLVWSKRNWNPDYRENREDTLATGTAPCKTACPAHIAVQGYLRLAAEGRYTDALELIKRENPFPAVCGRICNHRCETECTRGSIDEAVAIDEVKRFIADHDLNAETRFVPPMVNQIGRPYEEKIAIIGAGPAGMTCAYFLAAKGYKPTVFDKAARPGGMMMNGIPNFRLEKDVIQAEIDILVEMGVEFKCGVEVGKDITIPELRKQGYKGFYLAIGLQSGGKLDVPGADAEGVMAGIDFTKKVNLEGPQQLNGNVVVIGGGNIACDVARTAVRCGADSVTMYCLESYDKMPCGEEDRSECEHDGIVIRAGWGQTEIVTENGKTVGVNFRKCLSVQDGEGRFAPTFDDDTTEFAKADYVMYCIGQKADWGTLLTGTAVQLNKRGLTEADPLTYQTAEKDIFVGGDAYTGQKFVIDAIAAGKEAAISLHRIVHEGQTLTYGRDRRVYRALDKKNALVPEDSFDHGSRQLPGYNEAKRKSFGDARLTFTEEQVKKETARCLGCGATKVDSYLCIGCGVCTTKCKFDAIKLVKVRDWHAGAFETMPIKVAEHLVKKVGRAAAKPFSKE